MDGNPLCLERRFPHLDQQDGRRLDRLDWHHHQFAHGMADQCLSRRSKLAQDQFSRDVADDFRAALLFVAGAVIAAGLGDFLGGKGAGKGSEEQVIIA